MPSIVYHHHRREAYGLGLSDSGKVKIQAEAWSDNKRFWKFLIAH
jgi:hypothetical protein